MVASFSRLAHNCRTDARYDHKAFSLSALGWGLFFRKSPTLALASEASLLAMLRVIRSTAESASTVSVSARHSLKAASYPTLARKARARSTSEPTLSDTGEGKCCTSA